MISSDMMFFTCYLLSTTSGPSLITLHHTSSTKVLVRRGARNKQHQAKSRHCCATERNQYSDQLTGSNTISLEVHALKGR
jgi:hypothetical protein